MNAIEAAYLSAKDRLPPEMGLEQFKESIKDFTVTPVVVRDQVCGAILNLGPEIHACILPWARKRWLSQGIVENVVKPIIEKYGFIQTHVALDAEEGHQFVQKFGFVEWYRDDKVVTYILQRVKWA